MKIQLYKDGELVSETLLRSGKLYSAGRKESADIPLDKLPGISREHFEVDEDTNGQWRINVLSDVLLVQSQGQMTSSLTLSGNGEFLLGPYQFKYFDDQNHTHSSSLPSIPKVEHTGSQANVSLFNDHESDEIQAIEPVAPDSHFDGEDDKTAIQNFSGAPYIKIIAQNGKKSEYFRLEGNLWVIGNSESSSILINDSAVAPQHIEISKTDKGYFIIDQGSPQGTEVNGQKLNPKRPIRINSGDIILIGATHLQFELRDHSFKRKVNSVPLTLYKNPLVFFDQNIALVNLDEKADTIGSAEEVKATVFKDNKQKKKFMLVAAAVVCVLLVAITELTKETEKTQGEQKKGLDPFSQLSEAEQKIVVQTHKLAKQLYLNGNFELALVQLEKLHNIIPIYKDSQEMQEYCINSRELKRQQALIEQQKREQEELANRVSSLIAQCNHQYQSSDDIDGIKACLAPAMDLDPNNPGISQLISEVTARHEEKKIREKIALEQEDKIRRGRELFEKAKLLHNQKDYLQAMEAYENHIHSGLPDPQNLVKTSKRNLSSIELKIKNEKTGLITRAQSFYSGTQLRDALLMARKAQKVDPYDPEISNFIFKVEKELNSKMRNIFMDSVIDEGFGNLESCRQKWEDIVSKDVSDGEYYIKAKRKLKQYGYQP